MNRDRINPSQPKPDKSVITDNGEIENVFEIDFADIGFDSENELLSGTINFEIDSEEEVLHRLAHPEQKNIDEHDLLFLTSLNRK
ncbi:hypothetical protein VR7878_02680 [Vibrio ruber DSM 16370]|uniref:Uncharacterized protein n=1 Tax=Vibrio ruber (strain DSM 16370 / JCM 11486 / BCRC 17186 / CECT 7878 / LMG 23124 / VR1) TaxID=1123498 RepID=A0A1R4LNI8_VIBR1|nr:hypothetical protein [Vibrio ruber]SJN58150.1 hypothetical protein VR7878_02680 [Vibrio ruber DSM 16370]